MQLGEDKKYTNQVIAQFLYTHLEEYGDKIEDILKCTAYVMDKRRKYSSWFRR
jgi:hypothetical protein